MYRLSRGKAMISKDMKSLPASVKEQFQECWVVQKTAKRFSSIPIDQAHEQNNAVLKGCGGVVGLVGLTENPSAFRRWMVAGPEQVRLLSEFDSQFLEPSDENDSQHEQTHSIQEALGSTAIAYLKLSPRWEILSKMTALNF